MPDPARTERPWYESGMTRLTLERRQVWIYLAAIAAGLAIGSAWPAVHGPFELALWPILAVLLFATFTQVPLIRIGEAFADLRFLGAVLLGNFLVLPILVWGIVRLVPEDDALRLGLLLVLLVPCTDWFIAFTQLGRGDALRATAVTPLNLLLQLALLPAYLWLMAPRGAAPALGLEQLVPALLVVLVPLVAAAAAAALLRGRPAAERVSEGLGRLPVPMLAAVLLLAAGSQVGAVGESLHLLPVVVAAALAFLLLAAVLARLAASVQRLPPRQGRTLAFGFGTRNSFVVLPLALSLPPGWEIAAVAIVMQSLVELFGMLAYLWIVPRWLFPDSGPAPDRGSTPGPGSA